MAYDCGLSANVGLFYGIVDHYFALLGFPGGDSYVVPIFAS